MADLSPVKRGEGLLDRLDAPTLSVLMQMAREWRGGARFAAGGGFAGHAPQGDPISVVIQNRTGAALDQYSIVGIGEALVPYASDATEFKRRPQFRATAPSATTPFAVLQHPLANWVSDSTPKTIGRAVISGCTVCKLNVTASGDTHASPTTSTTELTTGTSGPARILAKESGTGAGKWGVVLLTNVAAVAPPPLEYASWSLLPFDGGVPGVVSFTGTGTFPLWNWNNGAVTETNPLFPSTGYWRVDLLVTGKIKVSALSGVAARPAVLRATLPSGWLVGNTDGIVAAAYADDVDGNYIAFGSLSLSGIYIVGDIATDVVGITAGVELVAGSGTPLIQSWVHPITVGGVLDPQFATTLYMTKLSDI